MGATDGAAGKTGSGSTRRPKAAGPGAVGQGAGSRKSRPGNARGPDRSPDSAAAALEPCEADAPPGAAPRLPLPVGALAPVVRDRLYPVLPLRGLAVYPGAKIPLQIGRPASLRAVATAMSGDGRIFFCAQRDPQCDEPGADDLYAIGTVAILREVRAEEAGMVRIVAEGLGRARALGYKQEQAAGDGGTCLMAHAEVLLDDQADCAAEPEVQALAEALLRRFQRLRAAAGRDRVGGDAPLPPVEEPGRLCDAIAARALQRPGDRQEILDALALRDRLTRLHRMLVRETEISEVERDVSARVRRQMERAQREYYLREQMKAIQKELGESAPPVKTEAEDLRAKLAECRLPDLVRERAERDLDRLDRMPPLAAEAVVVRTYLEWIFALPWLDRASEDTDLARAERVLAHDHYGLDKVKERVLEYLALRRLRGMRVEVGEAEAPAGVPRGPILCLVGPPGAGKTSLARSIARALRRPFVRISLGGVRDEAEIRGHRRTYVGAMPGRLIAGMRQAGKRNPVVLLDELDKLSADYRGDPAAALLEVLDPEQNAQFSDHYLELPFDLSEVMFIATANSLQPLARPLLDRLEVVALHGYAAEEKLAIARRYLLPRQIAEAGLPEGALRVTDGAIRAVVDRYTREAGVRGLERELGAICRKVARRVVARPEERVTVTARNLQGFLGRPRVFRQQPPAADEVGVATGLGWTETGGEILPIEVGVLPGRGGMQLTGKLGEVMRESAQTALSFLRSRAAEFGLPSDFFSRCELHVHAPEGAVPKDGPSAGITLAAALLSALTGIAVCHDVAMTGEITLRGRVLPVGGIREKVLAARRAGIRRVILPAANRGDWEEMGDGAVAGLTATFVEHAADALASALAGGLPAPHLDADRNPPPLLAEEVPPPAADEPMAAVTLEAPAR